MKPVLSQQQQILLPITLAAVFATAALAAQRAESDDPQSDSGVGGEERRVILKSADSSTAGDVTSQEPRIRREEKRIILGGPAEKPSRERAWLGLSTEEAPESLISQLKLDPGVGLVITYVAEDSPAAKAGLQKNDLLTRLGDQDLVHPAQLRKLVQTRKPGEKISLQYLREGETHSADLTLAKLEGAAFWEGERPLANWMNLGEGFGAGWGEAFRDQMAILRDQLGDLKIDKEQVRREVNRSLQEAKRAVDEALRQAGNSKEAAEWSRKLADELHRAGLQDRIRGSVTVTQTDTATSNVRTLVSSDDSGTIHLESTPELSLTARDKKGKLLFKGSIDTKEERAKVPRELWERVEPLLKQLEREKPEEE